MVVDDDVCIGVCEFFGDCEFDVGGGSGDDCGFVF